MRCSGVGLVHDDFESVTCGNRRFYRSGEVAPPGGALRAWVTPGRQPDGQHEDSHQTPHATALQMMTTSRIRSRALAAFTGGLHCTVLTLTLVVLVVGGCGRSADRETLIWHGAQLTIPSCYRAESDSDEVRMRAHAACTPTITPGVVYFTLNKIPPGEMGPFETWQPCAECDSEFGSVEKYRTRISSEEFECYRATTPAQAGQISRIGCRSRRLGVGVRYVCDPSFCKQLEDFRAITVRALVNVAGDSGEHGIE
jgi:hypothetical protein